MTAALVPSPTHTFDVDGKGHRMLARLREGPSTNGELSRIALGPNATNRQRRVARHVILTLIADGFAARPDGGAACITRAGLDALDCLDAGHPVTIRTAARQAIGNERAAQGVPHVRVFGRAA